MMEKALFTKSRANIKGAGVVRGFPEKTLRDFYYVIFRQKRKITLFLCIVIVATALLTFLGPKTYQSQAELLVRLGRESVTLDPTATTGQIVNIGPTRENEIKSELEILQSRDLAEKVVDVIGYKAFLTFFDNFEIFNQADISSEDLSKGFDGKRESEKSSPPQYSDQALDRDKAIVNLLKKLEIETQKNSNILSISYKANRPELAHQVVSRLIDFYLDKHISVHRTPGSDEFFSRQADGLRVKLAQTEETLRDLKNQTGVASVAEQRTILLNRIGSLQKTMEETNAALAASRYKVRAMEGTLAGLPKTLLRTKISGYSGNPIDYLQQRLQDLQLKEQDLLSKFTEKSQLVQEVRRQIVEAQALLKTEDATHSQVTQLTLLGEKATLSELQGKAQALKGELVLAQGELKGLNDSEIKIAQLQREQDIQAANYRSYSDKLEQARIDRALEMGKISNISVVQSATYPVKPIRPRTALNLALGLFLGIFGGLGLAFMAEYLDHSLKTPEDVGKMLDIPVLTSIPYLKQPKNATIAKEESRPLPVLFAGTSLQVNESITGQDYQTLVNHVLAAKSGAGQLPSIIAITSCHRGEGVSSVAANLANALARQKAGRILLVDANFNNPSAHLVFGLHQGPGLTDFLANGRLDASALQSSFSKNLDVMAYGMNSLDISLQYESKQFADLLGLFRSQYSFVIFDAPPIEEVTAGVYLSTIVDGVIWVIEAGRTRWEVTQKAQDNLTQARANVLGVVLNKRQFPIPERLYRTL